MVYEKVAMKNLASVQELEDKAREIRREIIRMLGVSGSGHPGGSLSSADIVTALYFNVMNHDPSNSKWEDRDRFILSKGHACPVLYVALALCGYFQKEQLLTFRKLGSPLQGHPDMRRLPGVEASTGSLGQGLSIAIGMALNAKLEGKSYYAYTLISDGETNEGQTWEAVASAAHYQLNHLIVVLDYNKFQLDNHVKKILNLEPMADKWRSFNWAVREIDGHNMKEILEAFQWAKKQSGQPSIIIAHTIKGKGVSFMENNNEFHGAAPTPEEAERALQELGGK
jgi:transketolase